MKGPLGAFTDGLRRHLADQGYALDSVVDHVHLFADLSDWLSGRDLTAADLTSVMAEEFLRERRIGPADRGHTSRARAGYGVSASPAGRAAFDGCVAATPLELVLVEYRNFLVGERGLAAGTVTHYLRCAKRFLAWLPGNPVESLPALTGGQVIDYVIGWTTAASPVAVDMVTLPALRSLLRFLQPSPRPIRDLLGQALGEVQTGSRPDPLQDLQRVVGVLVRPRPARPLATCRLAGITTWARRPDAGRRRGDRRPLSLGGPRWQPGSAWTGVSPRPGTRHVDAMLTPC